MKPEFLGAEYGRRFDDATVAASYSMRPPYPSRTIEVLLGLLCSPAAVLDVGAGTGDIARPLAGSPQVNRVDAVDPLAAMIAQGRRLEGGRSPRLQWIVGTAEDGPLTLRMD